MNAVINLQRPLRAHLGTRRSCVPNKRPTAQRQSHRARDWLDRQAAMAYAPLIGRARAAGCRVSVADGQIGAGPID